MFYCSVLREDPLRWKYGIFMLCYAHIKILHLKKNVMQNNNCLDVNNHIENFHADIYNLNLLPYSFAVSCHCYRVI